MKSGVMEFDKTDKKVAPVPVMSLGAKFVSELSSEEYVS